MNSLVWALEWRRARARRRLLLFNVVVPLALVGAVSLGGAPAFHASVAYTTLFVFFGTFGSAIPLVRDAEVGWVARVSLSGWGPAAFLLQRSFAGAFLDVLQLLPSVLLITLVAGAGGLDPVVAATALLFSLAVANLVGTWVGAIARSVAETALFSAVVALLLLHGSGVFRTPVPGGAGAIVERLSPFVVLHESLLALAGGPSPDAPLPMVAAAGWVLGSALFTGVAAPWMMERLSSLRLP